MKVNIWYVVVGIVILFFILRSCEEEPRIIVETETVTIIKTDTINKVTIKEVPKTVYVQKIKNIKGETVIIYQDKPSEDTITANQFETTLQSNEASAKLQITTTGELLDVKGVITYPEKETTTTITKIKDKSGFYIYGAIPINNISSPEVGALMQVRNKFFISAGVQYNSFTTQPDIKIGFGIRL